MAYDKFELPPNTGFTAPVKPSELLGFQEKLAMAPIEFKQIQQDALSKRLSNLAEEWNNEKVDNKKFFSQLDEIGKQATPGVFQNQVNTMKRVYQHKSLERNLETEFNTLSGDVISKKVGLQEAYIKVSQLSKMAAVGGSKNLSAAYYLRGQQLLNQIKNEMESERRALLGEQKAAVKEEEKARQKAAEDSVADLFN